MIKLSSAKLLELSDQILKTTQDTDDYFRKITEEKDSTPSFFTDGQESFKQIALLLREISHSTDTSKLNTLEKQLLNALIDHKRVMDMTTGTHEDILVIDETWNYLEKHMPRELQENSNKVNRALRLLGDDLITSYLNSPIGITIYLKTAEEAETKLRQEGIKHVPTKPVSIKTIASWCRLFNHREPFEPKSADDYESMLKL